MDNFRHAGIPQALQHRLEQIGFTTPTPIQAQAIPAALEGKDILGSAQTGTGKTGAFGVPLISRLLDDENSHGLILLPTRELALQVVQALSQFLGKDKNKVGTALLIGGDSMTKQLNQLRQKPRLIVGTPGRVNDHLKRKSLKLDKVNFLVLDEVDRMLDMGFGIQLDAIAQYLTAERQTLMFSATMPKKMDKVAAKYLVDPLRIKVGHNNAAAKNIKQTNIKLKGKDKPARLFEELEARSGSVIIFVKTKRGADRLAKNLKDNGHKSDALHGDLRQHKRTKVIRNFHAQRFRVLVATDVAARGLDIPHIEHVINYDLPQSPEDYIHRIGRTARAGAEGEAVNFISGEDNGKWRAIERLMNPDAKQDNNADDGNAGNSQQRRRRRRPFNKNGSKPSRNGKKPFAGNKHKRKDRKPKNNKSGQQKQSKAAA